MLTGVARVFILVTAAFALSGCSSINTWIASKTADYIPAWAGGIPSGAPHRPGTAEYENDKKIIQDESAKPASLQDQSPKPAETH